MVFYHNLDPVIFHLGPLEIRWYGVIYVLGFVLAYFMLNYLVKLKKIQLSAKDIEDLIFYELIGVVIGARVFYILFYNLPSYAMDPLSALAIWKGGLSFHGVLAGAFLSGWWFCRKRKLDSLAIADLVVIPASLALSFGRIANFINGELVGRVATVPWAVQFPGYDGARHPSQLYESGKNILIFSMLWILKNREYKKGTLFAAFIILYSSLRFFIEFFRAPDPQLGFLVFGLTMGQILNIAMLMIGLWVFYKTR